MPKPYSVDLRKRVLQHLERFPNRKEASRLFQLSIETVYRWLRCKKNEGRIQPLKRKYAFKRIDDQALIDYVQAHPDHFLSEIAKEFKVSLQSIFYALRRLKITRKKRLRYIERGVKKQEPSF